ncbi:putative choloylglycine hydrolase [Gordonia amicalis NBRC 100051 = JCM 11271]|nr:putative choloylglycine hydrolase [Gordonia amicalis NBRC 100051 = JCM 11271]
MCTRVIWPDANGSVLVGRNMDFHKDLMTNLWKQPRGVKRDDGVEGELTWTSKYGSVIAAAFDIISVDGLNEAGLAGHVLWLAESTYGTYDGSRTALSQAIWLQYFLDNFATVADAVAWVEETDVQVVQMDDPTGGTPPTIHLALDDATGDSAIIEYIDGHPKVYHDPSYRVMTNSPTSTSSSSWSRRSVDSAATNPCRVPPSPPIDSPARRTTSNVSPSRTPSSRPSPRSSASSVTPRNPSASRTRANRMRRRPSGRRSRI